MPNEVFLGKDGFIHQTLGKDMTPQDLRDDLIKLLEIEEQLIRQNKPIKILLDASNIKKSDKATRKEGLNNLSHMHYEKIGIFGMNSYMKHIVNFVLSASGMGAKIRVFNTVEEASEWFKYQSLKS